MLRQRASGSEGSVPAAAGSPTAGSPSAATTAQAEEEAQYHHRILLCLLLIPIFYIIIICITYHRGFQHNITMLLLQRTTDGQPKRRLLLLDIPHLHIILIGTCHITKHTHRIRIKYLVVVVGGSSSRKNKWFRQQHTTPQKQPQQHSPSSAVGPYRYSDPTLRRDALSRTGSSPPDKNTPAGKAGSASSPGSAGSSTPGGPSAAAVGTTTDSPSSPPAMGIVGHHHHGHSPHTDPNLAFMMEMEARAEGATSPSQIEDFHREEVTTMGCTCKKTKCLKLYCQCFGVKIYCGPNCRCLTCHNLPQYDAEREHAIRVILVRNPLAFDTKFQKNTNFPLDSAALAAMRQQEDEIAKEPGALPLPARVLSHKLGCKCRKSACMKKYCECYAGNVKCSNNCRCVGCKNMPPGGSPPPSSSGSSAKKDSAWKEAAYSLVSSINSNLFLFWSLACTDMYASYGQLFFFFFFDRHS